MNRASQVLPRLLLVVAMAAIYPGIVAAQYYPRQQRVDPAEERNLVATLQHTIEPGRWALLLYRLANIYLYKPMRYPRDLARTADYASESARLYMARGDTAGYNRAQLLLGEDYAFMHKPEAAEELLPHLQDTAKLDLLLCLGFHYWLTVQGPDSLNRLRSLACSRRADSLAQRLHQPIKRDMALLHIAMVRADQGDSAAPQEMMAVLQRFVQDGYRYLHYIYTELAAMYQTRGVPQRAYYYSEQTLRSMQATGDSVDAGDFYLWHASAMLEHDDYEQAVRYAKMAVERYKYQSGKYGLFDPLVFRLVTKALYKAGRPAEAMSYAKEMLNRYPPATPENLIQFDLGMGNVLRESKVYPEAEAYLKAAVALSRKHTINPSEAEQNLGQLYVESHQYRLAIPLLTEAYRYSKKFFPASDFRYLHYLMFLADSGAGDFRAAIRHSAILQDINEAEARTARDREVLQLRAQFETEKKEAALNLQRNRLRHAHSIQTISFALVGLLAIVAFLFYKQFRQKKKSNAIITAKNELITRNNRRLQELLKEKDILLKEVHHRVKNNLHTVLCLLESQAIFLKDDALVAIQDSQHRIYSMSLIHQKLYQSDAVGSVDMGVYLRELLEYLEDSFGTNGRISCSISTEPLTLPVAKAIPLALIVNEAVTNAIKHGFPSGRSGSIQVILRQSNGKVRLKVTDNGVGMASASGDDQKRSLGLELIRGLSTDLKGTVEFYSYKGTTVDIGFPQSK